MWWIKLCILFPKRCVYELCSGKLDKKLASPSLINRFLLQILCAGNVMMSSVLTALCSNFVCLCCSMLGCIIHTRRRNRDTARDEMEGRVWVRTLWEAARRQTGRGADEGVLTLCEAERSSHCLFFMLCLCFFFFLLSPRWFMVIGYFLTQWWRNKSSRSLFCSEKQ